MARYFNMESAGLLLHRLHDGRLEVLLVHPGGPFWKKRDEGAWSIPKGEIEPDETPIEVARREFREELGIDAPDGERADIREHVQNAPSMFGLPPVEAL